MLEFENTIDVRGELSAYSGPIYAVSQPHAERSSPTYQTDRRVHAAELIFPATQPDAAGIHRPADMMRGRRLSTLHAILAGIANLGALRVIPSALSEHSGQHDPRGPRNW